MTSIIDGKQRNYGIDLLRVLSMFFIVILHSLGHGGLLANISSDTIQYKAIWGLEIIAYCAVDIFALISGYIAYTDKEKKLNKSNYIKLWLQVVYYGLLFVIMFNICMPNLIGKKDYASALLPVTTNAYWYFTEYTFLFLLMPFLNKAIRNCSNDTLKKVFIIFIAVFSVYDTITKRVKLENGYSFVWLVILYVLGAIIKKCEIGKNLKWYKILIGIGILYTITFLYKMYGVEITKLDIHITKDLFISYISPTILGVAILYLILFSKLKFNETSKKIIKFLSVSAFSVYLINDNILMRSNIIKNLFVPLSNCNTLSIILQILSFAIIFVIASILIDKIRLLLFKILNLQKYIDKLSNFNFLKFQK